MKYKVTLNGRTYEVEVEAGQAMLLNEYEAIVPSAPAAPVAAPVAAPAAAAPAAAPESRGAGYVLAAVEGQFAGRKMQLTKPVRMGRGQGCDIQYPGTVPGISGNHCMLTPTAEGVVLTDLGSSYGTYLSNGTKLVPNKQYLLKKGDSFCLANQNQRFTIE